MDVVVLITAIVAVEVLKPGVAVAPSTIVILAVLVLVLVVLVLFFENLDQDMVSSLSMLIAMGRT
eukprot:8423944-Ditylum_brightwellii.AAC.2